jgi:hypothetical protein
MQAVGILQGKRQVCEGTTGQTSKLVDPNTSNMSLLLQSSDEVLECIWQSFATTELIYTVGPVCRRLRAALFSSVTQFEIDFFGRRMNHWEPDQQRRWRQQLEGSDDAVQRGMASEVALTVGQFSNLRNLSLLNVQVDDDSISIFLGNTLRSLTIHNSPKIRDIPKLESPILERLSLAKCKGLSTMVRHSV